MQTAALVARYFRIDPMVVLKSSYQDWTIRVAAYQHAAEIEKAANDKSKLNMPTSRRFR